ILVAEALGVPERGKAMAHQLKTGIERIKQKAALKARARQGSPPVPLKILLQLGDSPLVVAGRKSFLQEGLEIIATQNIYGDVEASYPRPSIEDVLKKNPDVIAVIGMGPDLKQYQEMANRWTQFSHLNAVKNKKVFVVRSDALVRPTLRLLEGLS